MRSPVVRSDVGRASVRLAIPLAIRSLSRCRPGCDQADGRSDATTRPAAMRQRGTRRTGCVSLLIRRLQVRVLPGAQNLQVRGLNRFGTVTLPVMLVIPLPSTKAMIVGLGRATGRDRGASGWRLPPSMGLVRRPLRANKRSSWPATSTRAVCEPALDLLVTRAAPGKLPRWTFRRPGDRRAQGILAC
jgi:hypothetical protein